MVIDGITVLNQYCTYEPIIPDWAVFVTVVFAVTSGTIVFVALSNLNNVAAIVFAAICFATITAAERWSITHFERLARNRPDECRIVARNADGTRVCEVPWRWMKIRAPRWMELTEEERQHKCETLALALGRTANTDSE